MARVLAAGLLAAMGCGCAAYRPLQLEPLKNKAAIVEPHFSGGYYYEDRDHTLYYVMRTHTTDPTTGQRVEEGLVVRVFWRPVGGKTTMEKTGLNATWRYIVMTPTAIGMYEGAGFVRLFGATGRARLPARIMDGDLRLTEASSKFVDNLGRARVRGNVSGRFSDVEATKMLHEMQQDFFARSLVTGEALPVPGSGGVTTQPATSRPNFNSEFLLPVTPATGPAGSATRP